MDKRPKSLLFNVLQRPVRIVLIPNEDGLGPSTALLYVARGIDKKASDLGIELEFLVFTGTRGNFWTNVRESKQLKADIKIENRHSVIELVKDGEKVIPLATAERLLDYRSMAEEYSNSITLRYASEMSEIDGVICMGTPVGHRPFYGKAPVIEIFDHCWPISLAQIFADGRKEHRDEWRTKKVVNVLGADAKLAKGYWLQEWSDQTVDNVVTHQILPEIEEDDRKVDYVFMFPEPLGPGEFWCRWQYFAPGRISRIEGVLGGWPDDKLEETKCQARKALGDKLEWPAANLKEARIVLVQGGGTPTWDRFLIRMLGQCIDWSPHLTNTLFLFTRRAIKDAYKSDYRDKDTIEQRGWKELQTVESVVRASETARLIEGTEKKDFANFQKFYLVANLIFSRPGGITVQDAIACRTPIVCAAEPGHWQTEKIREHCLLHGVLRPVKFEAFEAGGIGLVLDQFGLTSQNDQMKDIMRQTFKNQQEDVLAEKILGIIAQHIE